MGGSVLALLLSLASCTSGEEKKEEIPRPNVLIVLLDAARADHFGFYGYEQPSEKTPTLAKTFKAAGYKTILVGRNPFLARPFGLHHGFDVYVYMEGEDVDRSKVLTDRVLAELEQTTGPFFCYVHYLRPHEPYDAPEEVRAIFGRQGKRRNYSLGPESEKTPLPEELRREIVADYDAGLRTVDRDVGRLVEFLKKRGLLQDTILTVTSDHGEAFGEHGKLTHNSTVYEEMVHIPLVLQYPRKLKAEKTDRLAQTVDLFPTLTELAGVPLPKGLQGEFLLRDS